MLVQHFLAEAAGRLPEKIALVCDGCRLTYGQLDTQSDRLAGFLHRQGVRRHDRVALFLDNGFEAVIALFAVLKTGATFVLLNPGMKEKKLGFILNDCNARVLVADGRRLPIVAAAAAEAGDLRTIIWHGEFPAAASSFAAVSATAWAAAVAGDGIVARPTSIDIDLATIIYTSGSTGEPKGVMARHDNIVAVIESITSYLCNSAADIVLNTLPLSCGYGLYQVLAACRVGATVVLEKSFAFPYRVLETMANERVTGLPVVPTMVSLLLKMTDPNRFDLRSLRYITNAAAALPVCHLERLRDLFPRVEIYSMYGLTECARALYLPPSEIARRPASVGVPIPNTECLVVDERGQEVAAGEVGELVVRGRNVMAGYWNRPEETARTFRPGRWGGETLLYTGDLFRRDAEGFFYFVARTSDLIKTRGERVSPREIENVLCEVDGVAEAAVVGVPDAMLGQAIKAYVVPTPGCDLQAPTILQACTRQLESFMVPRSIEICSTLPKLPSGKLDRQRLVGDGSAAATAFFSAMADP